MRMLPALALATVMAIVASASAAAQTAAADQLALGQSLWNQRLSKSAIEALEGAAKNPSTAAAADEAMGRLYTFKGWQQEGYIQGWHDEPGCRERALAALRASVKIDPARVSAQEALRTAESFAAAAKVDPAPMQPRVQAADAAIEAARQAHAPIAAIERALEARTNVQADAAPYFTGAQILIDRGEYDKAIDWAQQGARAYNRFVDENLSAYQMSGKVQGQYARGGAAAADLVGWSLFLKRDYAAAAIELQESERLSQGADVANQYHLGELARARDEVDAAREHYLNALSLTGAPAPVRQRTIDALEALRPAPAGVTFDAWLSAELDRRREERRAAALGSFVDHPLPALHLTTVDGRPFDTATLRGKVVLIDFFAAWCGVCRQELPHLKASYARYEHDPGVVFLLISIDEDDQRLRRYLNEMKFPFPVARIDAAQAEQAMGLDNVPVTYYVDREGLVRYQINGAEAHGDSMTRVSWFVDQLAGGRSSQR